MFGSLQAWAAGKVFELVATGVVIVGLIGWYAWNNAQQRAIGEQRAVAKIEKANDNAVELGNRGVARARDQRLRKSLPRDPYTRDD